MFRRRLESGLASAVAIPSVSFPDQWDAGESCWTVVLEALSCLIVMAFAMLFEHASVPPSVLFGDAATMCPHCLDPSHGSECFPQVWFIDHDVAFDVVHGASAFPNVSRSDPLRGEIIGERQTVPE